LFPKILLTVNSRCLTELIFDMAFHTDIEICGKCRKLKSTGQKYL